LLAVLAERAGADIARAANEPAEARLPFDARALAAAVRAFRAAPPSPPSHSETYRRAYAPAYRVVLRRFGEALPALAQLEVRLAAHGRAVLVLDGDCASGKTTLAALLAPLYDTNVIHMDDFFLPFALRTPARMAEAGGNVHYERFAGQVLSSLLRGGPIAFDAFNCHTGESRPQTLPQRPVTVVEGSYALHPRFANAYDMLQAVRVLLRVDGAEQRRRILARNGAAMLKRFETEWIPLEKRYFQAYHSAQAGTLTLVSERHAEDEPQEADSP
jgi:uridine kinase